MEVSQVSDETASPQQARAQFRNDIMPQNVGFISGYGVGVSDEKNDYTVALSCIGGPSLKFTDRSGFPFVKLDYSEKHGVDFQIHMPLGIKNAFRQYLEQLTTKTSDTTVYEAYRRCLRLWFSAAPNADPELRLAKDGAFIWKAPVK